VDNTDINHRKSSTGIILSYLPSDSRWSYILYTRWYKLLYCVWGYEWDYDVSGLYACIP